MTQSSNDHMEETFEETVEATVEETVEATVSATAAAAVVEESPQIVDIEQESPKGWIGGIVGGLSSWKSQFGKKTIQSDL
jgi:methylmalonyl-CoA mutase cobalamin-binding subunit